MDHKATLHSMLQDFINDRMEQASATMHDYLCAKMRQMTGTMAPAAAAVTEQVDTLSPDAEALMKQIQESTGSDIADMTKEEARAALVEAAEQGNVQAVMELSRWLVKGGSRLSEARAGTGVKLSPAATELKVEIEDKFGGEIMKLDRDKVRDFMRKAAEKGTAMDTVLELSRWMIKSGFNRKA